MERQASAEDFDDQLLENVSNELGEAWPTVATYLSFDPDEVQTIIVSHPDQVSEQAQFMLRSWRDGYRGDDLMGDLRGALRNVRLYTLLHELGEEILDTTTLRHVAKRVGRSWPELALYLCFEVDECQAIQAAFPTPNEQAGQMLAAWRQKFTGDNPIEYLARALISMERDDIARELAPKQRLPQCPCDNSKALKYRPYYTGKGDDDRARLIGICCTCCGQEWLEGGFLFHPDSDNTRPAVKLRGTLLKKQLKVPVDRNPAFQVKGHRTKIANFSLLGDYLKIGDHITWHRRWGYWHHAIVSELDVKAGKVKAIHWSKLGCGLIRVMENWVDLKEEQGDTFRIDYSAEMNEVNTAELVIARAKSRLDDSGYGLLGDNCEAFASYCKTGVAESCQVMWLYQKYQSMVKELLTNAVKGLAKAGSIIVAKAYAKEGTQKFLGQAAGQVTFAESFERLSLGTNAVGAGIIIVFEGYACVYNLQEMYENRKTGGISRKDFIATALQRVQEAILGAGLAVGLGIAGQAGGAYAAGSIAGTFIFPGFGTAIGAFLGSIVGGVVGGVVGRYIGTSIGSPIGRALASTIGTDDRAVEHIQDLNPGDQVVFYGNLLHPRHHAIVVKSDPSSGKVKVVHNTYQKGVVEEYVDFTRPVYRLIFDENDCYPPQEVIKRARSKIDDKTYEYSLAFNNCKSFARWCKVK